MIAGIMQPYFFPYLGYFSLIKHVDRFILFDTVQYIRHGWIERNRILKPNEGWQYFSLPTNKHGREALIKDVEINNTIDWKRKILAQLEHYKKRAPYYSDVVMLLNYIFKDNYNTIVDFNCASLQSVCDYLGITTPIEVFSMMDIQVEGVTMPDEWALKICQNIPGINEYWNPPGGRSFFDPVKYEKNGIRLLFHEIELQPYQQNRKEFEPGLSVIDAMMFNSSQDVSRMLDMYDLS